MLSLKYPENHHMSYSIKTGKNHEEWRHGIQEIMATTQARKAGDNGGEKS